MEKRSKFDKTEPVRFIPVNYDRGLPTNFVNAQQLNNTLGQDNKGFPELNKGVKA